MTKKRHGSSSPKVTFKRHKYIGSSDARDDRQFLSECFVDTGALDVLEDIQCPEFIVLGRTGSGKTALLEQLKLSKENVIEIEPESLALSYIENSNVIRFFVEVGVNMDPFYRLLWRHVIAVELIRNRYGIVNEQVNKNIITRLKNSLARDKGKQDALNYFFEYGDRFWEETTVRIKGITTTIERELSNSVGGDINVGMSKILGIGVNIDKQLASKLTEEQKFEIQQLGQQVVSQVQIQKLTTLMILLDENVLQDEQKPFYVVIDRLDEGWVDDSLRFLLIRSLLETAHSFNHRVTNAKVVIAIREDLLQRVFRYTRSPGYQEEKYESRYISLDWTKNQLEEVILRRVSKLQESEGNTSDNSQLRMEDILPFELNVKGNKILTIDYMIERTLLRPRDIIVFFNSCIGEVGIAGRITQSEILKAEKRYSESRLKALSDEWSADYRTLYDAACFLKYYPAKFRLSEIRRDSLSDFLLEYLAEGSTEGTCGIYKIVYDLYYEAASPDLESIISELLRIYFKVGILGYSSRSSQVRWSYLGDKFPMESELPAIEFVVHPAFWSVLNIKN